MIPEIVIYALAFGLTALLVYVLARYGSVVHSWVKLDREQERRLRDLHDRYRAGRPRERPAGPALYKRRIISHDGLAVYPNGLYAKFCIGRKGRYRFVPFDEMSGVYPVRMENPLTKADSRWLGVASWKALQFETYSGLALLVTSLRHDFEKLVPVLRRAMGARWDALYRPQEVLWSNLLEGDALVHSSLRAGRPAAALPSAVPFLQPSAAPASTDKGALLLEESPEDLRVRAENSRRGSLVFIGVGAGLIAAGLSLLWLLPGLPRSFTYFLAFFPYVLLLTSSIAFVGAVAILVASRRLRPLRIYEHGIETLSPMGGRTFFTPFGEVTGVRERKNFIEGPMYILSTATPGQIAVLPKRTAGLDALWPQLQTRFGRPEHLVRIPTTPEQAAVSRKTEYVMYLVATLMGAAVSVAFSSSAFGGGLGLFAAGLGLTLPPFTMLIVTYMAYRIGKFKRIVPARPDVRVPAVIVVALLAYFLVTVAVGSVTTVPPVVTEKIEPMPVSTALASGTYENATLFVAGDILIRGGEALLLRNVSLQFNLSSDREFGLWVATGGTLEMENVTLRSSWPAFGYTFEIMGSATIRRSAISGLWGDRDQENGDGGLEIYSDDVVIEDSRISDAPTNGLLIVNASPTVSNTTIEWAGDDGIEVHASAAEITNNTISDCGWAMVIWDGSTVLVEGNRIADNQHGVYVDTSDPVIRDNVFDSNANYAIRYDAASHPILEGNAFVGNQANVVAGAPSYALALCGSVTVGIAVFCLLVLFWIHKEALRKEREASQPAGPSPPWT